MEGRTGKIWAIALIAGLVVFAVLLAFAGYGWFKGLLLALLVGLLVALITYFLWGDEAPVASGPAQARPQAAPAVPAKAAAPAAAPAKSPAKAAPLDYIPSGSSEGPPPGPSADERLHAHAIPSGETEGPAPNPPAADRLHAHAIGEGTTEGPPPNPSAADRLHAHAIPEGTTEGPAPGGKPARRPARMAGTDEETESEDEAVPEPPVDEFMASEGLTEVDYDEFAGVEESEEAHDDSGEPLTNRFDEAADRAPELPDHLTRYPSGRAAPVRAKAGARSDPRPAPRTAPRGGNGKAASGKPKPATKSGSKPGAKPAAAADDLKKIKGVGPKIEAQLHAQGITSFAQIAAFGAEDIARVEEALSFQGRIQRDGWIDQARILAAGGETEFSARKKR